MKGQCQVVNGPSLDIESWTQSKKLSAPWPSRKRFRGERRRCCGVVRLYTGYFFKKKTLLGLVTTNLQIYK